ncbi:MAG: acetate uptake transporter [Acidimicrobiales bacterium]
MTTFCLSSANANLWHGAGVEAALALAFFYGGLVQLLAGMWEFVRKNTFGAVAFSSYGAFWLAFYAIVQFHLAGGGTDTVGIFLLGWTIFTAYMTIAAAKTNTAIFVVFILLLVTFALLTIGNWGAGHSSMVHAGGWFGLATAVGDWPRPSRPGTPRWPASSTRRTEKCFSRSVDAANLGSLVARHRTQPPTAPAPRGVGRCWHFRASAGYCQGRRRHGSVTRETHE